MFYSIFPPIGIARLGNSPTEFFVGPEYPHSPGLELRADGKEVAVSDYKTVNFEMKRQASRFRLYEADLAMGPWRPAKLPAGTKVKWSVRLVNKKDAVVRPAEPWDKPGQVVAVPARADRVIDSTLKSVEGPNAAAVPLAGSYRGQAVSLGELRTDAQGNLLVLGGAGITVKHADGKPLGGFFTNPDWHDDVADGPVTASILLPGSSQNILAKPAWVVVAPPDFAPGVQSVVTLYDVIHQVGLDATSQLRIGRPAPPSFTNDILPIIRRARDLRWVNSNALWAGISTDDHKLADKSDAAAPLRQQTVDAVLQVEPLSASQSVALRSWQKKYLEQYRIGNFVSDMFHVIDRSLFPPFAPNAQSLTRTVLDGGVGQGFYPGIEAGIVLADPTRYADPLGCRLDHAKNSAGDLTALMALPWQADFAACAMNWWPSQRPNQVFTAENTPQAEWSRKVNSGQKMVDNSMRLGVVTPVKNPQGTLVQLEKLRDASLDAQA